MGLWSPLALPPTGKVLLPIWRSACGTCFGAGLSSLAQATTTGAAKFGPASFEAFGFPIPVMSALFGLIGLVLARRVAPISPAAVRLGRVGNGALTALLALGVLALVVAGEKRPLVSLGWAIGLGYSGLAFIELVSTAVMNFTRLFIQAFVKAAVAGAGSVEPDTAGPVDASPVREEHS